MMENGSKQETIYLMEVVCNKQGCYQHVTKEFFDKHQNLKGVSAIVIKKTDGY